jgi:hypothetical protein
MPGRTLPVWTHQQIHGGRRRPQKASQSRWICAALGGQKRLLPLAARTRGCRREAVTWCGRLGEWHGGGLAGVLVPRCARWCHPVLYPATGPRHCVTASSHASLGDAACSGAVAGCQLWIEAAHAAPPRWRDPFACAHPGAVASVSPMHTFRRSTSAKSMIGIHQSASGKGRKIELKADSELPATAFQQAFTAFSVLFSSKPADLSQPYIEQPQCLHACAAFASTRAAQCGIASSIRCSRELRSVSQTAKTYTGKQASSLGVVSNSSILAHAARCSERSGCAHGDLLTLKAGCVAGLPTKASSRQEIPGRGKNTAVCSFQAVPEDGKVLVVRETSLQWSSEMCGEQRQRPHIACSIRRPSLALCLLLWA